MGALNCGYTLADLNTCAMNNGLTKKKLVRRTSMGMDGYYLFAMYLGSLGYRMELALRHGRRERIWQKRRNVIEKTTSMEFRETEDG